MNFITERITSIDTAVFDECFTACKANLITNMPWKAMIGISVSDVTETFARDWVLARFQDYAARDSDTDGFVFQVKNAETGRVLAMYTAKKCILPHMPNTLSLLMVLLNTDEASSTNNWLSEYFKSDTLKTIMTPIGCTRWYQEIYTQLALNSLSDEFVNDGPISGRDRTRIYSTYGW